jgi:hypothetical protein
LVIFVILIDFPSIIQNSFASNKINLSVGVSPAHMVR